MKWTPKTKKSRLNSSYKTSSKTQKLKNLFRSEHKALKIFAAANHSFVITVEHKVFGWGDNSFGVLGLVDSPKIVTTPQQVVLYDGPEEIVGETNVLELGGCISPINKEKEVIFDKEFFVNDISTCQTHSYFLTTKGNLYVCGLDKGQLGTPSKQKDYNKSKLFKVLHN
jgi:alpha-tubulin suppressor-like RCC1 family protein